MPEDKEVQETRTTPAGEEGPEADPSPICEFPPQPARKAAEPTPAQPGNADAAKRGKHGRWLGYGRPR